MSSYPPPTSADLPQVLPYGRSISRWRRWLRGTWMVLWRVLLGLVMLCAIYVVWDCARAALIRRWASKITVGMTQAQVKQRMGEADYVFPRSGNGWILSRRYETWAYDAAWIIESEFPFLNLVDFRLFGPDDTDVAIEFDDDARVRRVIVPP